MTPSRNLRATFIPTMVTAIVAVVLLTTWLFWPTLRDYWKVRQNINVMRSSDHTDQACAAAEEALVRLGAPAVPALIGLVKDETASEARYHAAFTLGQFSATDLQDSIPDLIVFLKDPHPGVRQCAAAALSVLGPKAKKAVPVLVEALNDENSAVRGWAAIALRKIDDRETATAIEALAEIIRTGDKDARSFAVQSLGNMGAQAVPLLLELVLKCKLTDELQQDDVILGEGAAMTLMKLGTDAHAAVPTLMDVLKQEEYELVHVSVSNALKEIDPQAASTVGF